MEDVNAQAYPYGHGRGRHQAVNYLGTKLKTKKSKGNIESSSTDVAADVYHNRIKARHSGKDDFLFFNDIRDR